MPRGRKAATPPPAPIAPAQGADLAETLSSVIGTLNSLGLPVMAAEVEIYAGSKAEAKITIKARGAEFLASGSAEAQPEFSDATAEAPFEPEE